MSEKIENLDGFSPEDFASAADEIVSRNIQSMTMDQLTDLLVLFKMTPEQFDDGLAAAQVRAHQEKISDEE